MRHGGVPGCRGRRLVGWDKTLASGLYPRLCRNELLTADRNFNSFHAWALAAGSGAALLWRALAGLGLPVLRVLPGSTYLSVLIDPAIRGARRRAGRLAAAGSSSPAMAATVMSASLTRPRRLWCGWWSTTSRTATAPAPAC